MPTSSFSARKARRNNGAGHVENQGYECPAQAARTAHLAPLWRRPPTTERVSVIKAYLCAGDRRHEGGNARVRLFAGKGNARERQYRRQHRRGEGRRQIAGPARREEGHQGSGVRSRWLSLSWPRQGIGRCGTRERAKLLDGLQQQYEDRG